MEVFEYLWEKCGTLWQERHVIPVIEEMIRIGWCKGIRKLFELDRTHEIFESLGCHEKRFFYEKCTDIAERLYSDKTERSKIILTAFMKAMTKKPYATLTFMLMFRYVHLTGTRVKSRDISLDGCERDFYSIVQDIDALHDMAVEFHERCESSKKAGDNQDSRICGIRNTSANLVKAKYHKVIHKLIEMSFMVMIEPIPISDIWCSIKYGDNSDFRMCCEMSRRNWPTILTLQDKYSDKPFSDAYKDSKVEKFKPKKWKPLHYMIYYDRVPMMNDLINFAGRSVKRAMTIDSKKNNTSDDTACLRLTIRLKNQMAFHTLWRIANQWTLKHLHVVLKDMYYDEGYCEEILKVILKSHTTKDMITHAPGEIQDSIFKRVRKLIDNHGTDDKKLYKLLAKLMRGRQE